MSEPPSGGGDDGTDLERAESKLRAMLREVRAEDRADWHGYACAALGAMITKLNATQARTPHELQDVTDRAADVADQMLLQQRHRGLSGRFEPR